MNQYDIEIAEGSSKAALHLRDLASGEIRTITSPMLCEALDDGLIQELTSQDHVGKPSPAVQLVQPSVPGSFESIPIALRSEKAIKVVAERMMWIKRLQRAGERSLRPTHSLQLVLKDLEHKHDEKCPYKLDTLYRAQLKLDKHDGDPRAILPAFHRKGGPGGHRLHPEVEVFISTALNNAAMPSSGKLQPARIHSAVDSMVTQHNRANPEITLPYPSLPTITRRFNERFSAYEVVARNHGKARAEREFRDTTARIRADAPLDVVQYDDTDTCVFLVDDRTGLPWGRAWLTVGIDEYTGMVMGKAISEQPRSTVSAIGAVVNGVLPKNHADPEFALCKSRWTAYGHHGLVVLDNASYNTTKSLEVSLAEFGSEVEYARPHHPTDKAVVEHFNHRLKAEFSAHQPGWSGPKEDREMLDEGLGTAVMTLSEFIRHLNRWILDDYSNKPRTDGTTPREVWEKAFELIAPALPRRMISTRLVNTIPGVLRFRDSGGLLRRRMRYQSDEISVLRRKLGSNAKVRIRYNPMDLSYLLVQDPSTMNYLQVECIEDPRYVTGLTEYQHSLVLKHCSAKRRSNPSLVQMYEARLAIAQETQKLMHSKKVSERKTSYRAYQSGLQAASINIAGNEKDPKTKKVFESELERWTNTLSEIENEEMVEDI